jgi:hypothetical protein
MTATTEPPTPPHQPNPDDSPRSSSQELAARLEAISREQENLRRERSLLQREKPWHRRAQSWISLSAIVVSVTIFLANYLLSQKKPELTSSYVQSTQSALLGATGGSQLRLSYAGTTVENLCRLTIRMMNTGTTALTPDDFRDGPVRVALTAAAAPLVPGSTPLLLDVLERNSSGQHSQVLAIESKESPAVFTYLPSLLNRGESVVFEAYTSAPVIVSTSGKILNGRVLDAGLSNDVAPRELPSSPLRILLLGVAGVFGGKAVALIAMIIIFLLCVTNAMAVYSACEPVMFRYEYFAITVSLISCTTVLALVVGLVTM